MTRLDHIVIGSRGLSEGIAWAEGMFRAPPGGGGAHPLMGTHNALWRLGTVAYIEVIAVDPDAPEPGRPRWFGLDEPETLGRLAERPRLLAWVIRCDRPIAEAAARASVHLGPVERHRRGDLFWQLTVPANGVPPEGGAIPGLIEWPEDVAPPPERLPHAGLRLERLVVPGRPGVAEALASLNASDLATLGTVSDGLTAAIATTAGLVVID